MKAMRESLMPDHVDPVSSPKETADNIVSPPADSSSSTMEKALGAQGGQDASGRRARRLPVAVLWAVAVVIVVVDQVTKQWALSALADGRHTALLGRALGLVLVRNPGAARDLVAIIRELIRLNNTQEPADDIDSLSNRRVKLVGELVARQFRVGMLRMQRNAMDRMSVADLENVTPSQLINARPVVAAVFSFNK